MKSCVLFLLILGSTYSAPVEQGGLEPGSCEDASTVAAAHLALRKINHDRTDGYVFSLHRLSNVNLNRHGETGVVFYLTLDVVETNCSVLSRKDWKQCEARPESEMPVYGQCKAAIYINKPHRVVRLYKYNCIIRPVPAARVAQICPDCPTFINFDNENVQTTVSQSLEKFNKESGLNNDFALLKILRASAGMAMSMSYHVEYTIQETTCGKYKKAPPGEKCPIMTCEFSHKGFCKASLYTINDTPDVSVECEIYEQEAAEREKALHLLGDSIDHAHNDTHTHGNDGHDKGHSHSTEHDHIHDHTKDHSHHKVPHPEGSKHHHSHDHRPGSAHRHGHDHSHDHGIDGDYDHVHAYHSQAQNHTGDFPNQHHHYKHPEGTHTHAHDHEHALDHDHKHAHLHEHEHHHHHHKHEHEKEHHDHPEGMVTMIPSMDQPMTLPSFPDVPVAGPEVGVTLPLKPDPRIPGMTEPTIHAFPTSLSAQCPVPAAGTGLVNNLFAEDPRFKPAA